MQKLEKHGSIYQKAYLLVYNRRPTLASAPRPAAVSFLVDVCGLRGGVDCLFFVFSPLYSLNMVLDIA